MKHIHRISREDLPLPAFWWQWFGPLGVLKQVGKPAFGAAAERFGSASITDTRLYPGWS